jgi:bacterioferritin-associated ferredoxin
VIVCICRGVSDRQVRLAVANGASTLRDVRTMCDAGRGCGACHEQIQGMLPSACSNADSCPAAAIARTAPQGADLGP